MIADLSRRALATVIQHAREAYPAECCGVLIGRRSGATETAPQGEDIEVLEAVPAANLAEDPDRFLLDPQQHMSALRDARARGLAVVGFYHSHPHSPAVPSARDLAEASYPDHVHLIVSLQTEPPSSRLYCFDSAGCQTVAVRLDPDP